MSAGLFRRRVIRSAAGSTAVAYLYARPAARRAELADRVIPV